MDHPFNRLHILTRPFPLLVVLLLLVLLVGRGRTATEAAESSDVFFPIVARGQVVDAPPPTAVGPIWGVNFISSAEDPADAQQYANGLATGATWNRWPIYWYNVEQRDGVFDWTAVDRTVQADLANGLQINAILLGTPGFYITRQTSANDDMSSDDTSSDVPSSDADRPATMGEFSLLAANAATPVGLYEPIFTDGTNTPGAGKQINPANRWARFVDTAVRRYRPGGVLAQANGWPAGVGVTHWEIWNEPDLPWFWDGSLPDYAQLLKVAYLVIEQADPTAQVLFAGLANNFEWLTYYDEVLAIYRDDPLAAQYGYFHDIMATHSYFYAWQSWYHVWRTANTMAEFGLEKPIWLNESGTAAWDDYPGPVWDSASGYRATTSEQADFVIQNGFYAIFAGADGIFHFQLYDGCGNQPRGNDFPPHNGELCNSDGSLVSNGAFRCAGDANGLYTNPRDAACFTQHPRPETGRPNLAAFQVLTRYLVDVAPYWRERPGEPFEGCPGPGGPQEWIALYRPETQQRIVGMWARCGRAETAVIPATDPAGAALLVGPDGSTQTLQAQNGQYTIQLPAAANQNAPWDPSFYAIGGRPYILIEKDTGNGKQ